MGSKVITLVATIACLLMMQATSAFAENPAQGAYAGIAGIQQSGGGGGGGGGKVGGSGFSSVRSGSLPFTGLDAGPIALVGVILIGSGLALRRANRRTD